MQWLENLFRGYAELVRNLGACAVLLLAAATVGSSICFALLIPIQFVVDHLHAIIKVAIVYLLCVATYVIRYRKADPPEPEPLQQVAYPHLLIFLKSVFPVAGLAFFTALDDPLKSIHSAFVPAICVSSYMHVLVLLAILRRSQDYGVSDGCIAAAYAILYSWSGDSLITKLVLSLGVIVLTGFRNLQLQRPLPNPILPIRRRQVEMGTSSRGKQISQHEGETEKKRISV